MRDLRYLPPKIDARNVFRVEKTGDNRVHLASEDGNWRIIADLNTGFVYESMRIDKNRVVLRLQKHPIDGTDPVYFPAVSGKFTFVNDKLAMCELCVIKS